MLFNEDFHPATPPAITLANATGTGKHSADQWIKQFKTANQYVKYGDILSDNSHHYFRLFCMMSSNAVLTVTSVCCQGPHILG